MSRINRYKFTKNIYPNYIVLLTRKNNRALCQIVGATQNNDKEI